MKELAALVGAVAWPLVVGLTIWFLRDQIVSALDSARRQLAAGAKVRWKDFEFVGVNLSAFSVKNDHGFRRLPAAKQDLEARQEKYKQQKNLFLVHEVVATGRVHDKSGLPVFDILVKLIPHKHYGRLNDVARVEYYLGKYFEADHGEFGSRYIVEDGSSGFAVVVSAYGPTLCECTLFFHDGQTATCSRYLDFLGTDYVYSPTRVIAADRAASDKAMRAS